MTICIAAIHNHDEEPHIIVATDRMVTIQNERVPRFFESSVHKYLNLGNHLILTAGNVLFSEIYDKLDEYAVIYSGEDEKKIKEIEKALKENILFAKEFIRGTLELKRLQTLQNIVLRRYGLSMEGLGELLTLPEERLNDYNREILNHFREYSLGVKLLLVGFKQDKNKLIPKIYIIDEFSANDVSDLGFYAIGSGEIQSVPTLLSLGYDPESSLEEIVYLVYKAKKESENIAGVGKETEMMILYPSKDGKINTSIIDTKPLEAIYKKDRNTIKKLVKEININSLIL